jgi:diacylglycerol O-acyltransferase / wax synthase
VLDVQQYPIQRTSSNDLMELAAESTTAPMQVAAILILDHPVQLDAVRRAVADRVTSVRRFRQRLRRAPFGCGRPIWVDDADFAIERHTVERQCPTPGDDDSLLRVAAAAASDRLPLDRPLWSITVVQALSGHRSALVFVMHHVLADGIGGMTALRFLVDGAPASPRSAFPIAPPSAGQLFGDACRSRMYALRRWPSSLRLIREASAELRSATVGHPTRCSLNQPTGPRRQLSVVRADLAALSSAAHAHDVTINDILLTAVSGALSSVLGHRGEVADRFVFSVPVSGRPDAAATTLGNQVGAMLIEVTTTPDTTLQLAAIAETTRARRRSLGRGVSALLLGPAFRLMAQIGAFRWYVDRQRMITTLVTNVRGPESRMTFLGATVVDILPVSQITGNVTVSFVALSYCGTLVVTVVADPDHCLDLPVIASELQNQLDRLTTR